MTDVTKYRKYTQFLFFGYLRQIQNDLNKIIIPTTIIHIIKQFYPSYIIYGIGQNDYGQCGCLDILGKFTFLAQFSYLLNSITNIYCNDERIYFKSIINNNIYAAGIDTFGQLGTTQHDDDNDDDDDDDDDDDFVELTNLKLKGKEIRFVGKGKGNNHTFFVTTDNNIYVCGSNKNKQCGDLSNLFLPLTLITNINYKCPGFLSQIIVDIQCGRAFTIFLTENGKIWACGHNNFGQCAQNISIITQCIPKLIDLHHDIEQNYFITKICCGCSHTLCIDKIGRLYGFGNNSNSPICLNETDIEDNNLNIDQFWKIRSLILIPYFKNNDIKIKHIECGLDYSVCIDENGICYLFGDNEQEQLGNSKFERDDDEPFEPVIFQQANKAKFNNWTIIDAKCGWLHTVLLGINQKEKHTKNKINVITFGNNYYKQCSILQSALTYISMPHILDKQSEIKLDPTDEIISVVAESYTTIIITKFDINSMD